MKKDFTVGMLFIVISLFPLGIAMQWAHCSTLEWFGIVFAVIIYDRLFSFGLRKMFGIDEEEE
jgi:hypothetical protein